MRKKILLHILIPLTVFIGVKAGQNSYLTDNKCEFIHFQLCQLNVSTSFEDYLLPCLKLLQSGPLQKSRKQCILFPADTFTTIEKLKNDFCNDKSGKICKELSKKSNCFQKCKEVNFNDIGDKWSMGRFVTLERMEVMNEILAQIRCSSHDPKKFCSPVNVPENYKIDDAVSWIKQEYIDLKFRRINCRNFGFISHEYAKCYDREVLISPACHFKDEKSIQFVKKAIDESEQSRRVVNDRESNFELFCQGDESQIKRFDTYLSENSFNWILELQIKDLVCEKKDNRYISFMQSMAKVVVTKVSDSTNQCIFNHSGPVPDDKELFIKWFCSEEYDFNGVKNNNIFSVFRKCAKLDTNELNANLVSKFHVISVKQRQIYCLEPSEIIFDVPYFIWKSKNEKPEELKVLMRCYSYINQDIASNCLRKIGKLEEKTDLFNEENLKKAYCSSNPHYDSFNKDMAECVKENAISSEMINVCKRPKFSPRTYVNHGEWPSLYYCGNDVAKEIAEKCFNTFLNDQTKSYLREGGITASTNMTEDDFFRFTLTQRCIEENIGDAMKYNLFKSCISSTSNGLDMKKKLIICVEKKNEDAYKMFLISTIKYSNCNLPEATKCYYEKFGKALPVFDTVRRVRDWFCKQEHSFYELQKVLSCILDSPRIPDARESYRPRRIIG